MFDIGFWEIALIGLVALFVIGPERMPELVQTIGQWAGHFQRLISNLKREIEEETRSEEYKLLNKEFLQEDRRLKSLVSDSSGVKEPSTLPDDNSSDNEGTTDYSDRITRS